MTTMRLNAVILGTLLILSGLRTASADEELSVVINGRTGAALLRNDSSSTLQLDGYLLRSPSADVFNTSGWSRLANNPATPGWSASAGAPDRLSEANLFGSTPIAAGASLSLGAPYVPFAPTMFGQQETGLESIDFSYSTLSGAFTGDVEFISRNTIVLVVDPMSGAAKLQNQSNFNVSIDSYLVKSVPAVLDTTGWMPLAESLGGAGGWTAPAGQSTRIAEGNLFGATPLLANGGSLSLGAAINPALLDDETDLVLEFTVAGLGSIEGGVLFQSAPSNVPGDYSGNGVVDAADYTIWRDRLGQPFTLLNVNPAAVTPGMVDQEDYNFWKMRFGATSGSGTGGVSGGPLAAGAVPEPSAGLLAIVCGLWIAGGARLRSSRQVLAQ
jgi:hypothetical protein